MRKSLFLHIALVLGTMPMAAFADHAAAAGTTAIEAMPLNQALEMFARQLLEGAGVALERSAA